MEIRPALYTDALLIRSLAEQIWPDTFSQILSVEQIRYMLDWMYNTVLLENQMQSGHRFFIFQEVDHAIGFMVVELNHPELGCMKIHKLYLLPEVQRRGYGKTAFLYACKFATTLGQNMITLNVNRFNKAVNFYKKVGFQIVREEDIDIGNGFLMEDFVMTLKL
jgi:GNAT superfamily N-acetyltransferase